ncbi:MAG: polysaccharide deacetylase family protein [Cyanobacteria bacterium P01_A01_bin.123]
MSLIQRSLVSGISQIFSEAVFYKKTSSKVVSLTIDDVGDADTLKILDVIDDFNQNITDENKRISATFFVITDYLDDSGMMLDEILNRGHEIGNHGQKDHRHALLATAEFEHEVNQAHQILSRKSNANIKWFRPGQAFYNQAMLRTLKEMPGYYDKFALASVFPLDTFRPTDNPGFTLRYISNFIFPGSILVLHGGSPERTRNTVNVLSQLLIECKRKAYEVVTLTQLWESHL